MVVVPRRALLSDFDLVELELGEQLLQLLRRLVLRASIESRVEFYVSIYGG